MDRRYRSAPVNLRARSQPRLFAAALWVLVLSTGSSSHEPEIKGESADRQELHTQIEHFVLTDQDGKAVAFEELLGKPLVINFMYTSCPDVCPLLTASLKILRDHMNPSEVESVRFVSITTDPEIDTPKVLQAYSERQEADVPGWFWLTGTPEELSKVWKNFGVAVERKARGLIDHTTLTVIADREGQMRFAYFGSFPDPDALLEDLRSLEKEGSI